MGSSHSKITTSVYKNDQKTDEEEDLCFDFSPTSKGNLKEIGSQKLKCIPLKKSFSNCNRKFNQCWSRFSLFTRRVKKSVRDKITKKSIEDVFSNMV